MIRLFKLAAGSIRGLPRDYPAWDIGERGMAVLGPNGSGKSSIVDAIEIGLGKPSSVFPGTRAGVSWERGGTHVRGGPVDVRIYAKHGGTDVVIPPADPRKAPPAEVLEWMDLAKNSTFLLRRHQMLHFIVCQPSERYEQLGEFLNLGPYLAVEQALRNRADGAQNRLNELRGQIIEIERRLRDAAKLGPLDPPTEAALLAALQAQLAAAGLPPCPDIAAAPATLAELKAAQLASAASARLVALAALRDECQRLGVPASLVPALETLQTAVGDLEREAAAERELELIDMLRAGEKVIRERGRNECPLCESGIDREAVLRKLAQRIENGKKLTEARERVRQRIGPALRPARALQQAWAAFAARWPAVVGEPLPAAYAEVGQALTELVGELEKDRPGAQALKQESGRLAQLPASYAPLLERLQELMHAEGDGARLAAIDGALDVATAIVEGLPLLKGSLQTQKRLGEAHVALNRLHHHAVEARKLAVRGILDGVSATANRMYAHLHPGETVGASRLDVREAVNQSVSLFGRFNDVEEPPLLHYSESHLDTLGLCYFLAVRKHEASKNPEFKLVVLDDVLHSVDADHRARVVSLLRQEFADHQLIITTHDEAFFNGLSQSFSGVLKTHKIVGWDLNDGPHLARAFSSDMERVLDPVIAKTIDHQDLGATCGRVFERLLKELVEGLEVAVPAKFSREYMIGDLWPPLFGALKRQQGFAAAHPKLGEELDAHKWIRNKCGPHDTDMASPPTPAEVQRLAGLIGDLHRATHCEGCGTGVTRSETDDWRCACGKTGFLRKQAATAA